MIVAGLATAPAVRGSARLLSALGLGLLSVCIPLGKSQCPRLMNVRLTSQNVRKKPKLLAMKATGKAGSRWQIAGDRQPSSAKFYSGRRALFTSRFRLLPRLYLDTSWPETSATSHTAFAGRPPL